MSVRLTTPESRPDMCRPGSADAETEGVVDKGRKGGDGWEKEVERCGGWGTEGWEMEIGVGCGAGPGPGVVGAEEAGVLPGVGFSTTHILTEIVSTGMDVRLV